MLNFIPFMTVVYIQKIRYHTHGFVLELEMVNKAYMSVSSLMHTLNLR
jgi:hypothetical protein